MTETAKLYKIVFYPCFYCNKIFIQTRSSHVCCGSKECNKKRNTLWSATKYKKDLKFREYRMKQSHKNRMKYPEKQKQLARNWHKKNRKKCFFNNCQNMIIYNSIYCRHHSCKMFLRGRAKELYEASIIRGGEI